ncbi:MAG TPA: nucleotidyltransferase domain-containing protein [Methylomirabilota bacterium]|nr:nucleotidyltransferase domain-containing protein [Methylomirabilota bacterium]
MGVEIGQVQLRTKDFEALKKCFRKHPRIAQVKLFGSRAKGAAKPTSDIDLAIFAPGASTMEWSDIYESLEESSVLPMMDVVRMDTLVNESLREKIDREGVVIYP